MSAQQYLRGGREMSSPASDVGYLALSQSESALHWLYMPTEPIGVATRQIASALQASALAWIHTRVKLVKQLQHFHRLTVSESIVRHAICDPKICFFTKQRTVACARSATYRAADGSAQAPDSLVAVSIEGHLAVGHLDDPVVAAIPNLHTAL
jgi:hypothetical protein